MSCVTFNVAGQMSILRVKSYSNSNSRRIGRKPCSGVMDDRWIITPKHGDTSINRIHQKNWRFHVMCNIQFYTSDLNFEYQNYSNSNSRWVERKSCSVIMESDHMITPKHGDTSITCIHRNIWWFHVMCNTQYYRIDFNFEDQKL